MVSNAFTKLDRIIAIIDNTYPQQWSSEGGPGLDLFQREGIKFARAEDKPGLWGAWYVNDPETVYYAVNGLLAGCICYIANNFHK